MGASADIAIIGAGPYGLSIAAHLRGRGIAHRIFGVPMHSWRATMPAGMLLKSEPFASNLYEPAGEFTLKRFCAQNGLPYQDKALPVPLETMNGYGIAFQKRFVPEVEERTVTEVRPLSEGFQLRLDDGEMVAASRVVIAAGINYFRHIPESLTALPADAVSHSSQHHDLGGFKGRKVAVIGAGASAIDLAGLLADAGAEVELVVRRGRIDWLDPPSARERGLWERIRYPESGMSPGLRSRVYEDLPMLFRRLPEQMRVQIVNTFLGPAPPAWMKDKIIGRMPVRLGCELAGGAMRHGRVHLRLRGHDGVEHAVVADHVIAATGFRTDLGRLPFLDAATVGHIRKVAGAPALSADFETSIPGLYFAGVAAANTFGPVMRFMLGANYSARRLTRHFGGSRALRRGASSVLRAGTARA